MYPFAYHRPATLAEAVALLRETEDGRPLAGGQTLIPVLKQRLARHSDLIDLTGIGELSGIREEDGKLVIGATVRHADVGSSQLVRRSIPGLAELAARIGDPQLRNRGTLGGSIANNDPAADYPGALLALDAVVRTDRRSLTAADFFTGMFETALEPDEIVVSVGFARPTRSAYVKFPNPASRYAMAGVFVAQFSDGVRLAVTGAGLSVFRIPEMEAALARRFLPAALDGLTVPADDLNSDLHASAEYRAHLVGVMARRAVAAALA